MAFFLILVIRFCVVTNGSNLSYIIGDVVAQTDESNQNDPDELYVLLCVMDIQLIIGQRSIEMGFILTNKIHTTSRYKMR